jgi:hypothetical protein
VAISGDYLYLIGDRRLFVIDVSEPAAPEVLAEKPLSTGEKAHPFIRIHEGRAFVLQGGLWVLDLSDPETPVEGAFYPTAATTLDVVGNRVYLLGPKAELDIVEFTLAAR